MSSIEVITQMVNGVIVIDKQRIVLENLAAHQLLSMAHDLSTAINNTQNDKRQALLNNFQQKLSKQHTQLLKACLSVASGQSRSFTYDLPAIANASVFGKLRVQITPLKDDSKLVILEDLRREHASAQQLKLASLGQLTASIAHEIRNPLAAISQASQLLMEDMAELDAKNAASDNQESSSSYLDMAGNHELYKMIFSQTKRVNRIIEDVLKLSRQQKANQQSIVLAEWLPVFLENYFKGHDVFLHVKTQPIISFDTHQLEQVLINLINNGLRHSSYAHPHAYVEIEVYCVDNDVIIDALDGGTGVKAEELQHLFNPFFTTDQKGTGLGLYLSQAFCEANQARLLYVPEHEKTCFRLIAPAVNSDTYV